MKFSKVGALLAGLGAAAASVLAAGGALADDVTAREGVRALTLRAAAIVAEDCGLAKARERFHASGEFRHDEIYVNVIDLNGMWRIYPPNPRLVGKSVLHATDEDGKPLVQDIIRVATGDGEGWTTYRWLNPVTNRIERKTTFVKFVPACGLVTYIGVYG